MTQKYPIFILVFAILISACKVQNKMPVGNDASASQKTEKKDENLFISAMRTNYIIKDSSKIEVYVEADFENLEKNSVSGIGELSKKIKVNWTLQPSSGIKEKLDAGKIELGEASGELKENTVSFHFTIPRLKDRTDGNLALEFIDPSAARKFTNELYIDFSSKRPNHLFGMYVNGSSSPSFQAYRQAGQRIVFRSEDGLSHELLLKYYEAGSPAALSPMSNSKRDELGFYTEKERRLVKSGEEVLLDKEGTYVVFKDTSGMENGYGFLVTDDRFPRLTMPEDLTEPLVYMSTNDEITRFKASTEYKQALDLYFLHMTSGNQALAKTVVRSFYRRVEKANKLFTTYKEGWKTDKGMIYLILGPPSRIQKNGNREVWLYAQSANFSEIIFTFYRKPHQFSEDHYELVRYPEYGAYWYPFVEAWRTGSVLE